MKKLIIPFLMLLLVLVSCGKSEKFTYNENDSMTLSHHDENYEVSNEDKKEVVELLNDAKFKENDEHDGDYGWVYCIRYQNYSILLTSYASFSKDDVSYVASDEKAYEKLYNFVKNLYIKLNGEDVK